MNLSPIHWFPVQDKGSYRICVKLGAMEIIPSDPLTQEYLTIHPESSSDWRQLHIHSITQSLTELLTQSLCTENAGARAVGCQFMFQTLHATSQDGSSLEIVAATKGRECNIQDSRGGGLWYMGGLALIVISPKIWEFPPFFMSTLGIIQPHLKSFSDFIWTYR